MIIDLDPYAGFCFGVAKAIEKAQVNLAHSDSLRCLGEIVHNQEEISRLAALGLQTVDQEAFQNLKNTTVMIRAHGEPPETYTMAKENNIELIEATCPVVLGLQKKIRRAWAEMVASGGVVIIAGKRDHPEVTGLAGQTGYQVLIVESAGEIEKIDLQASVRLFAQTTFSRDEYEKIRGAIEKRMQEEGGGSGDFKSFNSVCGQVSGRIPKLRSFCKSHDVVIFVSGKNSANGKNLFEICKAVNPSSYFISSAGEFNPCWTTHAKTVGISGATSTPQWLMERVANTISGSTKCT